MPFSFRPWEFAQDAKNNQKLESPLDSDDSEMVSEEVDRGSKHIVPSKPIDIPARVRNESAQTPNSFDSEVRSESDDREDRDTMEDGSEHGRETFHCETCGKAYKQRQSLLKHRWEHTEYWEPVHKQFRWSKHQVCWDA